MQELRGGVTVVASAAGKITGAAGGVPRSAAFFQSGEGGSWESLGANRCWGEGVILSITIVCGTSEI